MDTAKLIEANNKFKLANTQEKITGVINNPIAKRLREEANALLEEARKQ